MLFYFRLLLRTMILGNLQKKAGSDFLLAIKTT
uniref:Uncharacterized protein n=1 Tax=Anguilla anguilla TaxID=7936 RepID=A0A0E9UFS8_ANGAN